MSALEEWSETVKLIIKNRISNLQRREFRVKPKILEDRHVRAYLNELHEKYVLVPADKAGNNIIFVCKYYLKVINLSLIPEKPVGTSSLHGYILDSGFCLLYIFCCIFDNSCLMRHFVGKQFQQ